MEEDRFIALRRHFMEFMRFLRLEKKVGRASGLVVNSESLVGQRLTFECATIGTEMRHGRRSAGEGLPS